MKRILDLSAFERTLPYASEVFGVYQPLLGWKSKRSQIWFDGGVQAKQKAAIEALRTGFRPDFDLDIDEHGRLADIANLVPATAATPMTLPDTVLMREIRSRLPEPKDYDSRIWNGLIDEPTLGRLLATTVRDAHLDWYARNADLVARGHDGDPAPAVDLVRSGLARESATAGLLLAMQEQGMHEQLRTLAYGADEMKLEATLEALAYDDAFDTIDPKRELDRVGLSPIGIVSLYRQYFFEFATFLGVPVGHVWLSPGATVELVETSTRRTLIERMDEQSAEMISRSETASERQDDLSEAVKSDNRSEAKFGVNVKGEEHWIWGSASQSASYDRTSIQQSARETAHKHMRRQSDKLSSEIRRNYKSSLRVVTEVTDTSSKRYVLTNDSKELVNYELRRKMRQVGVQVQDIGTYLCWETYVDEPGQALGISQLVHIGSAPEAPVPHPAAITRPGPIPEDHDFQIWLKAQVPPGTPGEVFYFEDYNNGKAWGLVGLKVVGSAIQTDFPQTVHPPQAGYYLDPNVPIDISQTGEAVVHARVVDLSQPDPGGSDPIDEVRFTVRLDSVNFHGQSPVRLIAKLKWLPRPSLIAQVDTANLDQAKAFTQAVADQRRREYVAAARERIELASGINPRRYEDLREEERIVVYRKLLGTLLPDVAVPGNTERHAASELINSIFDVEKMLYFVAPEWWKPREHSAQFLGSETPAGGPAPAQSPAGPAGGTGMADILPAVLAGLGAPTTSLPLANVSSWGGTDAFRKDNYYITEKSNPAKLGASLGWLLQLDGDDLRNAFLNAPWVKAVIPIRPGKSKAALNWLQQVDGMNGIGPGDYYSGAEPALAGKTMVEALEFLAEQVEEVHAKALVKGPYPPEEVKPAERVSATPVDRVYEHGFYPLKDGFSAVPKALFDTMDQWLEILPTDQIAAVEVEYDPATGMLKP